MKSTQHFKRISRPRVLLVAAPLFAIVITLTLLPSSHLSKNTETSHTLKGLATKDASISGAISSSTSLTFATVKASSKGTTVSNGAKTNENTSGITTISASSTIAASLRTFIEGLSTDESNAALAQKITYEGFIVSPIVLDGGIPIALAAFSYDPKSLYVKVIAYQMGSWSIVAQLSQPSDERAPVDPSFPWIATGSYSPGIRVGDVTDNQTPTFLIPLLFADNIPGAFVVQTSPSSISSWTYATFSPSMGNSHPTNVLARSPSFVGNEIMSTYDNCIPDCASGSITAQYWQYDPTMRSFVPRG